MRNGKPRLFKEGTCWNNRYFFFFGKLNRNNRLSVVKTTDRFRVVWKTPQRRGPSENKRNVSWTFAYANYTDDTPACYYVVTVPILCCINIYRCALRYRRVHIIRAANTLLSLCVSCTCSTQMRFIYYYYYFSFFVRSFFSLRTGTGNNNIV
jgi:hypothetical protein